MVEQVQDIGEPWLTLVERGDRGEHSEMHRQERDERGSGKDERRMDLVRQHRDAVPVGRFGECGRLLTAQH
ncbi:hypothetical protein [Streptomyces sp. NPDC053427]|uniref:hypothetical protein n=1 Tax=Streptomyces sp. NPDC053427 TaxID=3365701 RepID=UPI0037D37C3D